MNSIVNLIKHSAAAVVTLSVLSACGGGGGGSSSPSPTPVTPTTPAPAPSGLFSKYEGLKNEAVVDSTSAYDIAYYVTSALDTSVMLVHSDEFPYARFDRVLTDHEQPTGEDCDSGQLIVGELKNDTSDVEYINCALGPYTFNGKGTLSVSSVSSNGESFEGTLSFDSLTIDNSRMVANFEGTIEASVGEQYTESAIVNGLLTYASSGVTVFIDDVDIDTTISENNPVLVPEGRIYISPYGYVDITTMRPGSFTSPSLALAIAGSSTLIIKEKEEGLVSVGLFSDINSAEEPMLVIPFSFIGNQNYLDTENTAPLVSMASTSLEADRNEFVLLDASESSDADNDLLTFQWSVLSAPEGANVTFQNNGFNNTRVSFTQSGQYQLQVIAFDGKVESDPVTVSVYVKQSLPQIELASLSSNLQVGEVYSNNIEILNPEGNGPFEFRLVTSPLDMQITNDGSIEWKAFVPNLGYPLDVNFEIEVSNRDYATRLKHTLTVATNSTADPVVENLTSDADYYEVLGNIAATSDGYAVGSLKGVFSLNEDRSSSFTEKAAAELEPTFISLSTTSLDTYGWEIFDSTLVRKSFNSNAVSEYVIGVNGGPPEFKFVNVAGVDYILVKMSRELFIVEQDSMQEEAQLTLWGLEGSGPVRGLSSYTWQEKHYIAIIVDDHLVILQKTPEGFEVFRKVKYPTDEELYLVEDEPAIVNTTFDDTPFISIMVRERINVNSTNPQELLFNHIYNVVDDSFVSVYSDSSIETSRITSALRLDYCSEFSDTKAHGVTYVITPEFNLTDDLQYDSRQAKSKVYALDMRSGELIWESDFLMADSELEASLNNNIYCDEDSEGNVRLTFATGKVLYQTH
ncbi:PKD domain-containing protein [Alteromonas sp. KUL150]|uniref:PKD domain-containing protein n=1 Tax=unclassified Alteromonas TaxID=2614992 RepID=UPI0012E504A4|nr:hypothetical protein [Alteromonas sp. KUL150]GFD71227.1 hypothetical protein KUL113_06470 [Tenacibaculum sp. KUL113]GFD87215.1 hypothetical protein KUL150_32740 [Alteromonas sp. KUL150]